MAVTSSMEDRSVARARDGDREAWADLYQRFHPAISRFLHIVAPDVDPEIVWAKAAHALGAQPVGVKPLVWLFGVARECITGEPDPTATDEPGVAALRRLPARQRELLAMRIVGRLGEDDVASIMGWAEPRISTASHAALTELVLDTRLTA